MKIIIALLVLVLMLDGRSRAWAAGGSESAEAFLVTMIDQGVKVVSPEQYNDETSVIIDNKTLSKIVAKLETVGDGGKGEVSGTSYVSIPAQTVKSISFKFKGPNEVPILYPLAPAFQEIPLIAGKKSYEIPPKD